MNTAKEGTINVPTPAPAALPLAHESTVQDAADLYRCKGTYMDPSPIGHVCAPADRFGGLLKLWYAVAVGEKQREVLTLERSTDMAQVNPDPHAHGYVFIPTNRVTGIFASYDDLQGALRALEPLGFDPQHIDVFAGPEGAELLDLCGQRHGVGTRILRNLAALVSDDTELHQQADATLRAGGGVIGILMDGKEPMKEQVAAVLKANNGRLIHYWGRLITQRLG
jgi:hypothetical protein